MWGDLLWCGRLARRMPVTATERDTASVAAPVADAGFVAVAR